MLLGFLGPDHGEPHLVVGADRRDHLGVGERADEPGVECDHHVADEHVACGRAVGVDVRHEEVGVVLRMDVAIA